MSMVALIYPLGHYLGPTGPAGHPVGRAHNIRVGDTVRELQGGAAYTVWTRSHGRDGVPTTREQVTGDEGPRSAAAVDDLLETGLLCEIDPDGPDVAVFAGWLRLDTLLVGWGTRPGWEGWHGVGTVNMPLALVDSFTYQMWQWAPVCATLWQLAEGLAEDDDTAAVAGRMLRNIHPLLACSAAYLDLAPPEHRP